MGTLTFIRITYPASLYWVALMVRATGQLNVAETSFQGKCLFALALRVGEPVCAMFCAAVGQVFPVNGGTEEASLDM